MSRPNTFVKIPKNRVGVLIGPNAGTKKLIEKSLGVKLDIDSDGGGVNISLNPETTDPSTLFELRK